MTTEKTFTTSTALPLRRRLSRISLRLLLVLVALLAVWLAWLTNRARNQAEVVRALQVDGSKVGFDYQYQAGERIGDMARVANAQPAAPAWLRRTMGEEYFRKVVMISWGNARLSNEVEPTADDRLLARMASLPGLRKLSITGRSVSSRGFVDAGGFGALEDLRLDLCPNVSDVIFKAAARMPSLRWLYLHQCPISGDERLGLLNALARLRFLSLSSPLITDAGLAKLDSPSLRVLMINSQRATGAGLASLALRGQLETLGLQGPLTDDGLASLRPLKNLSFLFLVPTADPITDRALEPLRELTALRQIQLGGQPGEFTQFTESAILDLVDSLPSLLSLMIERKYFENQAFVTEVHKRNPRLPLGTP